MKRLFIHTLIISLAFFSFSCEEKDCCALNENSPEIFLLGTWQLYERGYSPGSGYVIEPVPEEPIQSLIFEADGTMSSNIQGLADFKFYYLPETNVVAFFKSDPGPSPDPSTITHSYTMTYDGIELKLYYRFCIEGCHLGFKS